MPGNRPYLYKTSRDWLCKDLSDNSVAICICVEDLASERYESQRSKSSAVLPNSEVASCSLGHKRNPRNGVPMLMVSLIMANGEYIDSKVISHDLFK